MAKTKEESAPLKEEYVLLNAKLKALSEDKLKIGHWQCTGDWIAGHQHH